jgi:hypothetical protein
MRAKTKFFAIFLMLSLAVMGCQLTKLAAGQPTSIPVSASTAVAKPLFSDDFSDPSSGWDRVNDEEGINDYANGGYRIFVNKPNWYFWSNPGLQFSDVVIDVDAQKNAGPDENDFGIICRYQDEQNFYFFIISTDGYYSIKKIFNGEENWVGMDDRGFNDTVIKLGSSLNHITAKCYGSSLTLSVNGIVLADVNDTDLSLGDVGLIAGSYENPGVDILFDKFLVTRP